MMMRLTLAIFLSAPFMAMTQDANLPWKVAVVSLIGNQMTVDTYRPRIGTKIDANLQEFIPVPTPVFDNIAISEAANAVYKLFQPNSSHVPGKETI